MQIFRVADGNVAFGNVREEITPIRHQEILDTRVLFDRSVENNGDGDVITRRSLVALMNVVIPLPALHGNRNKVLRDSLTFFAVIR